MKTARRRGMVLALFAQAGAAMLLSIAPLPNALGAETPTPQWIWLADKGATSKSAYFRKEIQVPDGLRSAKIVATCDNAVTLLIDGKPVVQGSEWSTPVSKDVTTAFAAPRNAPRGSRRHILAAKCQNEGGPAGLLVRLTFETRTGPVTIVSDASWLASEKEVKDWASTSFDDKSWTTATVVGSLGDGPWTSVNEASLAAAVRNGSPKATPPEQFKVAKGFKVELLYTVPKDEQGSWVNMTVDPKGRLIVSDQYGKLYRVSPPPVGSDPAATKIEPIEVELGEAQGLTWAFDSLYVVVNRGERYASGLYRVSDTNSDDKLDKVERLRALNGGGEHGPHAVIPSPDGKSLYVVAGNATALTELSGSLVPRNWGEDQVLPYMPDGRGFMRDERAPGGCIYKVTPDGQHWELVSMGYRNPYDLAFNRNGDLFTYDSDMEWDVNLPWYRPTRVCQADSGSDLGYRNGSGKWPTYYPDSLPPIVDIGPGSPTGISFGYGAKFPAKYQEALYICDWSYGKLYAVHLAPTSSTYKAEVEEFVTGTPLPLTDVVVNPTDKAMYFTVGGRRTLSGLYRVSYTGAESTEPSTSDKTGADARAIRHKIESFHGHADPAAVAAVWPYLGHADRFIRYAARVALEFQPAATWQERALAEKDTEAAISALLALARTGDKGLEPRIIDALGRLNSNGLDYTQKLEVLRVLGLTLIRMGKPEDAQGLIRALDALYPAKGRELNAELCKVLVALQAPDAAAKTMALLATAPTQEEQIEYATALRMLRTGWTPELRKAYYSWFRTASHFKGGPSLTGFLKEIRDDAVATLSPSEKTSLKPLLEIPLEARGPAPAVAPRPFVKTWTVDELVPLAETKLTKRDFDRGRSLFAAAQCFSCHRFNNEGGSVGPDLTVVSGRFSPRDLLESIVQPSKSISDQYGAVIIGTSDGRVVTGRIVNLHGDSMMVNTNMLDPTAIVNVNRSQVEEVKPSPVSMMPEGLLNTLKEDEVLDMLAYLLSRGDRTNKMFQ